MRILLLLPYLPFPADTGQLHRYAHVARYLARHEEVYLACFCGAEPTAAAQAELAAFADVRLCALPPEGSARPLRWLSPAPSEVRQFSSAQMRAHVDELMGRYRPDVIVTGDPAMTAYIERYHEPVRVVDYVCETMLSAERIEAQCRGLSKGLWRLRRLKMAAFLKRIAPTYDLCILNSQEDFDSLARVWPRTTLRLITNGLELPRYPLNLAAPEPGRMIFPGSIRYAPNFDAVQFFVDDILPRIREKVPNAHLVVTGPVPDEAPAPQGDGVSYTGYVDNVQVEIARAWLTVVPLRLGAGGARFKVLESLALGTPMVCTAIGYEGLAVRDGVNILCAEDPASFAAQASAVLQDPDLRQRIARGGRALMESTYNWALLGAELRSALQALVARNRAAPLRQGRSA